MAKIFISYGRKDKDLRDLFLNAFANTDAYKLLFVVQYSCSTRDDFQFATSI